MVALGLFPAESSLLGKDSPPTPTMYKYRPGYSSSSASAAMPHSSSAKVLSTPQEVGLQCRPPALGTGAGGGQEAPQGEKTTGVGSVSALGVPSLPDVCPSPRRGTADSLSSEFKTAPPSQRSSLTSLRLIPCLIPCVSQ